MEYNYLVTYKARKNKEDKEINSTIPIILDCPIYQPEVLMHVNEAIKDLHRYDDIMLMNVEVLNLENEEIKNDARLKLPSTGGLRNIKTYLPLIGGSVLILIAAYFVLKRKYQN